MKSLDQFMCLQLGPPTLKLIVHLWAFTLSDIVIRIVWNINPSLQDKLTNVFSYRVYVSIDNIHVTDGRSTHEFRVRFPSYHKLLEWTLRLACPYINMTSLC